MVPAPNEQTDPSAPTIALVVFGGGRPDLGRLDAVADVVDLVVAADSGAAALDALGRTIDVVVGDMDSIDPSLLDRLERDGTSIERHPATKDATDLELAIRAAIDRGATVLHVIGGHGGRVDQSFANAFVLSSTEFAAVEMHAVLDSARLSVVHGGGAVTFEGAPGDVVTILPMHGAAIGVRTVGLEYPLHGETLPAGTTRGVSNVQLDRTVTVTIESGTAVVIRPGPEVPEQFHDQEGIR